MLELVDEVDPLLLDAVLDDGLVAELELSVLVVLELDVDVELGELEEMELTVLVVWLVVVLEPLLTEVVVADCVELLNVLELLLDLDVSVELALVALDCDVLVLAV